MDIRTDFHDNRPRILDLALAARLGYLRHRDIRHLIRLEEKSGRRYQERQEVREPGSGIPGRPGREFWLTLEEAGRIVRMARTAEPETIMSELRLVFDGKHPQLVKPTTEPTHVAHVVQPVAQLDIEALVSQVREQLKSEVKAQVSGAVCASSAAVIPPALYARVHAAYPDPAVQSQFIVWAIEQGLAAMVRS